MRSPPGPGLAGYLLGRRPFLTTVPTIGVTVSDVFTSVCIDGPPARVTGMYRVRLDRFAHCGERAQALQAAALDAFSVLRAPVGAPTVVALEPAVTMIDLPLVDGWSPTPMQAMFDDDVMSALTNAGFRLLRFDAVPLAMARFAWSSVEHWGRLTACGWTIEVTGDRLVGFNHQSDPPGPTGAGTRSSPLLTEVAIPRSISRHLVAGLDAAALGAAMRSYGHNPDTIVEVDQSRDLRWSTETGPTSETLN